jgi:hypothetical protein
VEDLAHDNDRYISDQAFKPWHFYSADFSVAFYDQDLTEKFESIQQYIDSHRDFFLAHGIESVYNVQAKPMRFPIAVLESDLDRSTILKSIAQRQWINSVEIQ